MLFYTLYPFSVLGKRRKDAPQQARRSHAAQHPGGCVGESEGGPGAWPLVAHGESGYVETTPMLRVRVLALRFDSFVSIAIS